MSELHYGVTTVGIQDDGSKKATSAAYYGFFVEEDKRVSGLGRIHLPLSPDFGKPTYKWFWGESHIKRLGRLLDENNWLGLESKRENNGSLISTRPELHYFIYQGKDNVPYFFSLEKQRLNSSWYDALVHMVKQKASSEEIETFFDVMA